MLDISNFLVACLNTLLSIINVFCVTVNTANCKTLLILTTHFGQNCCLKKFTLKVEIGGHIKDFFGTLGIQ